MRIPRAELPPCVAPPAHPSARQARRFRIQYNRWRRLARWRYSRIRRSGGYLPFGRSLRPKYYGRDGWPIDEATYCFHHDDMMYLIVARDCVLDGWVVSTVWIGADLGVSEEPKIFETMLAQWRSTGSRYGLFQARYSSIEEARSVHAGIVAGLTVPDQTLARELLHSLVGNHNVETQADES